MLAPTIVSREEWLAARVELLEREKALNRERDALAAARRHLPWVEVSREYTFDTQEGPKRLAELFAGRSQLIVYHFMFGPDWEAGCKSCSFWADSFDGLTEHLAARDATLIAVSRASLDRLSIYKQRMGWRFEWVSSRGADFNVDFGVSFEGPTGTYNYREGARVRDELPGISVFARRRDVTYHTYSTYARGLDMLNAGYHYLDLLPKGRDEADLDYPMAWVRRRDEYPGGPRDA